MEDISRNSKILLLKDCATICDLVAEADAKIKMGFIRKVFGIVALQLIATSFVSAVMLFTPIARFYVNENPWLLTVAFVMCTISFLLLMIKKKHAPLNYILLLIFTFVESYTAAVIVAFYDQLAILLALITCSVVVITIILYTLQSQKEFNFWHAGFLSIIMILFMVGLLQEGA